MGRKPIPDEKKAGRISISLPPKHMEWLAGQDGGPSEAIQGLIDERIRKAARAAKRKEK